MTDVSKPLLIEIGVTLDCALACGEKLSAEPIIPTDGEQFNQLIFFITEARTLCSKGQQPLPPGATEPNLVFPRFSYPPRVVRPPSVIYPRPEVAREAASALGAEGLFEVIIDGAGRGKIVPFDRDREE